jgi:glycosyltransferase involved in cell wall biosynthesis
MKKVALFGPFSLVKRRGNSIRILLQAKGLAEMGYENYETWGYEVPSQNGDLPLRLVGERLFPKLLPVGQSLPRVEVDLVHAHHFYGAMVLRQPFVIDLPSLISPQIEAMYRHGGPLWKRLLLRRVANPLYIRGKELATIRKAATVVVASEEIRDNLREHFGLKNLRYRVVRNPVEMRRYSRSSLDSGIVGLSASDFRDGMDAHCLDVLALLAERHPKVPFHAAGLVSPQQEQRLRRLPNVTLRGSLDHSAYVAFLQEISIFLMPYLAFYDWGGSKFKLLEAGAAGLPVISSPYGAIGFNRKDCLVIAETVEEFSAALVALQSLEYRQELGGRLRQAVAEDHDHVALARLLAEVHEEAMP